MDREVIEAIQPARTPMRIPCTLTPSALGKKNLRILSIMADHNGLTKSDARGLMSQFGKICITPAESVEFDERIEMLTQCLALKEEGNMYSITDRGREVLEWAKRAMDGKLLQPSTSPNTVH